jgi:hypothetical protein
MPKNIRIDKALDEILPGLEKLLPVCDITAV